MLLGWSAVLVLIIATGVMASEPNIGSHGQHGSKELGSSFTSAEPQQHLNINFHSEDNHIFYKNLVGKYTGLTVLPSEPIVEIKAMIQASEQVPLEYQKLFFNGKELEDMFSLSDYKIGEGSALSLMVRISGGGCSCSRRKDVIVHTRTVGGDLTTVKSSINKDELKKFVTEDTYNADHYDVFENEGRNIHVSWDGVFAQGGPDEIWVVVK